jgi:GH15 family glucan-1,4-alpha-glucosidase
VPDVGLARVGTVNRMPLPIEDYAVIGDSSTAALIGRDGSVDWLCLPRFDSQACFAALLGGPENGRWLLGPTGAATCTRRYLGATAVLESTYVTATGTVRVVDSMPVGDRRADLVRQVVGVDGSVELQHEWVVRPGYGRTRPWIRRTENRGHPVLTAVAGPDRLALRATRLPHPVGGRHRDEFTVHAGQTLSFVMTWSPSWVDLPSPVPVSGRLERTVEGSEEWAARCSYAGPHAALVMRSLLTLRLLTHGDTGGIVAAATTSLPEDFGGERNWDYRYCWLRDASLTLEAFLACGYTQEAMLWRHWLLRAVAGDPEDVQIMYAVDGARDLPERQLDHLPGYLGSRPVRVGNGAVGQRQTDVLGEVMIALEKAREAGVEETDDSWSLQRALVDDLADHWTEPDHGLWEIRGPRRHFTHSRVMVWAAFDRAVRAVEQHGLDGPVEAWRTVRDAVREEVLQRGYDAQRNTFVQHYDTGEVDAALLMLPLVGFLDGDDPRMIGTIEAVRADLEVDGLLLRYRTSTGVDGLRGEEHPFLACSFWLVSALAAAGRVEEARELLDRLVLLPNDLGLLPEEYDVERQRFAGNFPQALSHLTLIGAAVDLARAEERAQEAASTRP